MTLTTPMLEKLVTPKQGSHVSRLPTKCAKTNAKLIAELSLPNLLRSVRERAGA